MVCVLCEFSRILLPFFAGLAVFFLQTEERTTGRLGVRLVSGFRSQPCSCGGDPRGSGRLDRSGIDIIYQHRNQQVSEMEVC